MTRPDKPPLYLAIDQGGHASRALVFDDAGHGVAVSKVAIKTTTPAPGFIEHDPDLLALSIDLAIHAVLEDVEPERVRAAGFAAQRSSVVCWDRESCEALSPVISWQDTRAASWLAALDVPGGLIRRITGLVPSAHYGASKLRWCLDHLSPVREALDDGRLAWGPLASFVLFRSLEDRPHVVDPAIASRTLLWDRSTGDWSPTLLKLFGLPSAPLPQCVPSRHAYGHVRDIPLTVMTGDQSAALFAGGEPGPDEACVNIGTGAFVQRVVDDESADPAELLRSTVWRDDERAISVLEATVNGAGSALTQVAGQLQLDPTGIGELLERKGEIPVFLNGVSGLGSPWWVTDFESRFVGAHAGGAASWQRLVAVAESIVFLIQTNLEVMATVVPPPARLSVSGGLAGVDGLCRRLADLSGIPVVRREVPEATARGLAWLVAGRPAGWEPQTTTIFEPRQDVSLAGRYHAWRCEMVAALA